MAGETRKADAIATASKPRMVCRISGARIGGIDRRVGTGEHQRQAIVGDCRFVHGLAQFLGQQAQVVGRLAAGATAAGGVDQPAPRHRHQPRLRVARNAGGGPIGERGGEGVGQRVLRRRDIAAARRQEGNQLPIAAARHGLSHLCGGMVGLARHYMTQIGRTSIAPTLAPGQRAAQESAASRSGTSIR